MHQLGDAPRLLLRQTDGEVDTERPGDLLVQKLPGSWPVMRRITSPTRNPYVIAWYPDRVPGSHQGSVAARRAQVSSQS